MDINIKVSKIDLSKITDAIKEAVFGRQQMKEFMQELANNMRSRRIGLGFGVEKDLGPKIKLTNLSPKYVKFRKKNPYGELSELTKANKSNLTYSGQMLKSITGDSNGTLKGEIYFKDPRRPVMGSKKAPTNSQVAEWNEASRPFFHVTDSEYKQLVQSMQKKLNAQLKKTKI
jgi:hypothetical protein